MRHGATPELRNIARSRQSGGAIEVTSDHHDYVSKPNGYLFTLLLFGINGKAMMRRLFHGVCNFYE